MAIYFARHCSVERIDVPIKEPQRVRLLIRWRRVWVDAICWVAAVGMAALLRYDFDWPSVPWHVFGWFMVAAVGLQLVAGMVFNVYQGRYRWSSFEGLMGLGLSVFSVGFMLWLVTLLFIDQLGASRTVMLIATPLALLLMFVPRYLGRIRLERNFGPNEDAEPVLLFGAGHVGNRLVQWMLADRESPYCPVGLLDDDPGAANLRIQGVPVLGRLDDLPQVAPLTGAKILIVALGDPTQALLVKVNQMAAKAGLKVKVMPPIGEVVKRGIHGTDLRDLSIEDLMGRHTIDTNVSSIAGYLNGRRVLVTGAGGSIGSQLCAEIMKHGPATLMMLDRDETLLQQTAIETMGNGLLDTDDVVLADIRDAETLKRLFLERRPQVVFHAAALKHLPMLEQYPDEAWKTNVLGTLNVLRAAEAAEVETFINISTDKAANPTSVLGLSKRVAERLTSGFGQRLDRRYLSVRFGNVIGSRGSMLPTFERLITEGKPLTVTHPDVTRYFMTIPEACQLVLQAGGIGRVGEVLILDMGKPVRILDIAEQMIAMSGKDIEIVFTGLREGEKLDEELHGSGEVEERPFHPLIGHAAVKGVDPERLDKDNWDFLIEREAVRRHEAFEELARRVGE